MGEIRPPAVAGRFYERSSERLTASLRDCFLHPLGPGALPHVNPAGPGRITALVSPHAGVMFSGPAAANGFAALAADGIPETIVLLGPSHYALDRRAALSPASAWRTPLGEVALDTELATALRGATNLVVVDAESHREEHSLEVQVPFLQFVYGARAPKLLPLLLRAHPWGEGEGLLADVETLARALVEVIGDRRVALLASSDFSHQVPHEGAAERDRPALDAILACDPAQLLRAVAAHRITTCGPVAVAVALAYSRARGATEAELLRYYTSGDIIDERTAVVAYASVVLRRGEGANP
jgi:MEMO1 family protein